MIRYDDGFDTRINPSIEKALRDRRHSLGDHPALPHSDEDHFEEKLISQYFKNAVNNYKLHHNTDSINQFDVSSNLINTLKTIEEIENGSEQMLANYAVELVMSEFDIEPGEVDIRAEIWNNPDDVQLYNQKNTRKVPEPYENAVFDNHEQLISANAEAYKRRFLNVMAQGAALYHNDMFDSMQNELMDIDPRLPGLYHRLLTSSMVQNFMMDNDFTYSHDGEVTSVSPGGVVDVKVPTSETGVPVIEASAINFPILIHELVKGVMQLINIHGLPDDDDIANYAMSKSDFTDAEPWDMRLGPALYGKFLESIPESERHNKHHVYNELVKQPCSNFNRTLREIIMGSRTGKSKVNQLLNSFYEDRTNDEFENYLYSISDDDILYPDDLDDLVNFRL